MNSMKGVYKATKKDGSSYYRSSITYRNKHISLGSYAKATLANSAYNEARHILTNHTTDLNDPPLSLTMPFDKWVILHNFRDHGYYFPTPIYLYKNYFVYFLDADTQLFFDVDDLFYYSSHPIHQRGGYYFVNDYGMQINILNRYNIRNHAVLNKDYIYVDNNPHNLRYDNIIVYNPYYGVEIKTKENRTLYKARIHINGNIIIGRYKALDEAAVAYNKAVDFVTSKEITTKKFEKNYIVSMDLHDYTQMYEGITLSPNLLSLANTKTL